MHPLVSSTWDEEERGAAIDVIMSGNYTMGHKVSEFEKRFAEYVGTKYAVMVNSGSSANLLMVGAYTLRYGPGVVFCPAVGWSTSFSPFQQYGWKVIFLDINRETLNFEPVHLWRAVEKYDDPVILAVNLLGNPNDFNAFPRKAHILEDNCESLGAEYSGRKTGSIGLMGTHSFFFAHHICTMEGGAITTNDELFYETLLCLRSHGWTRHLKENNVLKAKVAPFEFIFPGYNVRPGEINGAVGLSQLDKLDKLIEVRRDNAARFPLKTQKEIGKSSWYGFAVFGQDVERVGRTCETRPIVTGNFTRSGSLRYYDSEIYGVHFHRSSPTPVCESHSHGSCQWTVYWLNISRSPTSTGAQSRTCSPKWSGSSWQVIHQPVGCFAPQMSTAVFSKGTGAFTGWGFSWS